MHHRRNLSSEDVGEGLSALCSVPVGNRRERYIARDQGENLILLPETRILRVVGRRLFGIHPDPIGALTSVVSLPMAALEVLEELASDVVGTRASIAGLRFGTGGRRKLTVAFADEQGPLAIAKFPLTKLAEESLAHEGEAISLLRGHGRLVRYLPELVSNVQLGGTHGAVYIPGPVRRVRSLSNDVVDFLIDLHLTTRHRRIISESGVAESWIEGLKDWRPLLGVSKSSVLEKAIGLVSDRIDGIPIDHVSAHGDFTRWNVRIGTEGLYVFDWEASFRSSLPYHDLFHFLAADAALLGQPSPASRLRRRSLRSAAERIAPAWVAHQHPLYVGYLVRTVLWYARSRDWEGSDRPGAFWRFLWAELRRHTVTSA